MIFVSLLRPAMTERFHIGIVWRNEDNGYQCVRTPQFMDTRMSFVVSHLGDWS